ncbi:unnamed protein product [Triticum turgidum subsp. durum]|uniref:CREG-like beta-barrel domain-containing protein n=1 Tax=Triticum turgidum subsp. durum TaxID=4567 RepID=A0A9R1R512_TRITD|nr:unnamed protein product [Triticum turgidum subsp. durum]
MRPFLPTPVGAQLASLPSPSTLSRLLRPLHLQNRHAHAIPAPTSSSSPLLHPPRRSSGRRGDRFLASSSPSQMAAPADAPGGSADAFEVIRAHQVKAARLPPVEEIRTILDQSVRGVLATHSQEHVGYPSGSMVDFACDQDGSPILAVSSLAVHSKNLAGSTKCSLLVAKDPEDRTDTVITVYGDATPVPDEEKDAVRTAYLRRHPEAFWLTLVTSVFCTSNQKLYVTYLGLQQLSLALESLVQLSSRKQKWILYLSSPLLLHCMYPTGPHEQGSC